MIFDTILGSILVPSTDFFISKVVYLEIGFFELCANWTKTPAIL